MSTINKLLKKISNFCKKSHTGEVKLKIFLKNFSEQMTEIKKLGYIQQNRNA